MWSAANEFGCWPADASLEFPPDAAAENSTLVTRIVRLVRIRWESTVPVVETF